MLLEHDRRASNDLRNMMSIWRERLPHKCETIQTWQDILENRRYIFQLIFYKMQRQLLTQRQQQASQNNIEGNVQISTAGGAADPSRQGVGANLGSMNDASNSNRGSLTVVD